MSEEAKKIIVPGKDTLPKKIEIATGKGPHISGRSNRPGWSNMGRGRKSSRMEYHVGDMPEDVYMAGIAAAEAAGHPDPMNYWKEDNHRRFKAWIAKHPEYGPGTNH
jgi:hypothetical protein